MRNVMEIGSQRKRVSGFTLIELMITVAIIGILAAIAYPNYTKYVLKANRSAAQSFLLNAAQRQQQYFLDNRGYAANFVTLFGAATTADAIPTTVSKYYGTPVLNTDNTATPPTFLITATPIGNQATNNEPVLTINQAGAKTPTGTAYGAW